MGFSFTPRNKTQPQTRDGFDLNITGFSLMRQRLLAAGVSVADLNQYWPGHNDGLYIPAGVCRDWATKLEAWLAAYDDAVGHFEQREDTILGGQCEARFFLQDWQKEGTARFASFLGASSGVWYS